MPFCIGSPRTLTSAIQASCVSLSKAPSFSCSPSTRSVFSRRHRVDRDPVSPLGSGAERSEPLGFAEPSEQLQLQLFSVRRGETAVVNPAACSGSGKEVCSSGREWAPPKPTFTAWGGGQEGSSSVSPAGPSRSWAALNESAQATAVLSESAQAACVAGAPSPSRSPRRRWPEPPCHGQNCGTAVDVLLPQTPSRGRARLRTDGSSAGLLRTAMLALPHSPCEVDDGALPLSPTGAPGMMRTAMAFLPLSPTGAPGTMAFLPYPLVDEEPSLVHQETDLMVSHPGGWAAELSLLDKLAQLERDKLELNDELAATKQRAQSQLELKSSELKALAQLEQDKFKLGAELAATKQQCQSQLAELSNVDQDNFQLRAEMSAIHGSATLQAEWEQVEFRLREELVQSEQEKVEMRTELASSNQRAQGAQDGQEQLGRRVSELMYTGIRLSEQETELRHELVAADAEARQAAVYLSHAQAQAESCCEFAGQAQLELQELQSEQALAEQAMAELRAQCHGLGLQVVVAREEWRECEAARRELLDLGSCCVCLELPRSVVLYPCRHYALCGSCAMRLFQCPVCRTTILGREHVISP
ncbi:unnamed protein product [Polarella glacialis]|uniref:RING-type domain-containing protein n=1 Tax=Polarella glacialis TaxID=89957 RepID=A0A813HAT2_POLGL|nr:unnamed protein product [Polarella glacialis]